MPPKMRAKRGKVDDFVSQGFVGGQFEEVGFGGKGGKAELLQNAGLQQAGQGNGSGGDLVGVAASWLGGGVEAINSRVDVAQLLDLSARGSLRRGEDILTTGVRRLNDLALEEGARAALRLCQIDEPSFIRKEGVGGHPYR